MRRSSRVVMAGALVALASLVGCAPSHNTGFDVANDGASADTRDDTVVRGDAVDARVDATTDAMADADSGTPCSTGQMLCGTHCVDLQTDDGNCGSCGHTCTSPMTCRAGQCRPQCAADRTDCDGVCRNLQTDPLSCGACGTICQTPMHASPTCAAGVCGFQCSTGYADCDGDASNGCEVDLQGDAHDCGSCGNDCGSHAVCTSGACASTCGPSETNCFGVCTDVTADPLHCGRCGYVCSAAPRASATCIAGNCDLACDTGFGDCDHLRPDGCEVNLTSNVSHCGACGMACPAPAHSAPTCVASVCGSACVVGWGDCNGNAGDGCETNLVTSATNCGGCGSVCPTPAHASATCIASGCGFTCDPGFADCDGNAANGCEADLTSEAAHCGGCGTTCPSGMMCTNRRCEIMCAAGETNCSGSCFDLVRDPQHCGACGTACATPANGSATCTASGCGVACNTGFGDCNGVASDGCEVNLASDSTNCGACGTNCPAGTMCTSGRCEITCLAGQTACAGSCFDLATDPQHCGACGTNCATPANGAATCAASSCGIACTAGYGDCNGTASDGCEANLSIDSGNCGACGAVCGTGTSCVAGHCQLVCSAPTTLCGGACANLATDPANCGTCGVACVAPANSTATCGASTCGSICNAGFGDCDRTLANGCEADIVGNVANCGACGNVCATPPNTTASCTAGTCGSACNAGFAECDAIAFTGCESNVLTGAGATLRANCGACGITCDARSVCSAGACTACTLASAGVLPENGVVSGTLAAGATNSRIGTLSCQSTPGAEDVWLLVIGTTSRVQLTTAGGLDTVLGLRRNCALAASEMACNNDIVAGDVNSQLNVTLDPGQYYVIVDTRLTAGGSYILNTSTTPVTPIAANGDCAAATLLDVGGLTNQVCSDGGAASNACSAITVTGTTLPYPGPQLFYAVDIPAGMRATVTATPSGATTAWKPVLRVLDRCDASQCMAGVVATTAGAATSVSISNPDVVTTRYYVSVTNGTPTVNGVFDLALSFAAGAPARANTTCVSAQPLTPSSPAMAQTIGSAVDIVSPACAATWAANAPGRMLYYSAPIPAYTTATFRMTPTGFDALLQVLPQCSTTACLASANAVSSGVLETVVFRNNGPPTTVIVGAGSPVYSATGTFDLTVTLAPYGEMPIAFACDDMSTAPSLGITTDDAVTANAPLPFAFSFFNGAVNNYTVSTNGFLQLFPDGTGVGVSATNNASTLPSTTTPNGYIAPFWDDLKVPASGGNDIRSQTFGTPGNRHFTVEWSGWAPTSDLSGRVTFQAQLYEATNAIEFHYCSMTTSGGTMSVVNGISATVGVENAAGNAGWAHSINTGNSVRTGAAIRLMPN